MKLRLPKTMSSMTAVWLCVCTGLLAPSAYAAGLLGSDDPRSLAAEKLTDLYPQAQYALRGLRPYGVEYLQWLALQPVDLEATLFPSGMQYMLRDQLRPSYRSGDLQFWASLGSGYFFTDSRTTSALSVAAITNPLLLGRGGRFHDEGHNAWIEPELTLGWQRWLHIGVRPSLRFSSREVAYQNDVEFDLQRAYLGLQAGKLLLQVGRDQIEWGVGRIDHLVFGAHHEPLNMVRLRTSEPLVPPGFLRHLGPTQAEVFVSYLDGQQKFPNPILLGSKFSCKPMADLELGFGYTVLFGGDGAPSQNPALYFGEFVTDAKGASNRNFVIDARYRIRALNIEPYMEILVEDCCDEVPINPRDMQNLFGLYLPAVDAQGRLDMALEWTRTNQITYRHGSFTSGYAHRGIIMGHNIGPDATSIAAQIRYWWSAANWLKLTPALEIRGRRGVTISDAPITTQVPGYQVPETRYRLVSELNHRLPWFPSTSARGELGYEWVTDFNFRQGQERANWLAGIGLHTAW